MLKKRYRLTKRGSFAYVYRKGASKRNSALSLIYIKSSGGAKAGFSVSNKIGKAVVRNKIKRRLRSALSCFIGRITPSQIVFVAKESITEMDYLSIKQAMQSLLTDAGLLV